MTALWGHSFMAPVDADLLRLYLSYFPWVFLGGNPHRAKQNIPFEFGRSIAANDDQAVVTA